MTHVYSGLSTLNARDFSLRNVCFGSKSWHWILGFREAGTKSGGFTGFKDICWVANWLVWWKGGDPQTVQHYEKVLQERCFFFLDFSDESLGSEMGLRKIWKELKSELPPTAALPRRLRSAKSRKVQELHKWKMGWIFVDICGWLKSTIWLRSQKKNLNMIWCPDLFGNVFGYLQCIRQTFDRIRGETLVYLAGLVYVRAPLHVHR